MSLLAVVNPSRRRRRRKASARRRSRRGVRRMTAKQLKYFGPRRSRRSRRANPGLSPMLANPRRRRRSQRRAARRSFRRNPIGMPRFRAGYIMGAAQDALVGAGGAVATDVAMAQVARFLPDTLTSRFNAEGGLNFGYYGVKAGIAVGLGMLGTQFLPGRWRGMAAKGAAGALTVQAYELVKGLLPANVVLGYMTPGRTAALGRTGAYVRRRGVGAYLTARPSLMPAASETRVGEGAVL